MTYDHQTIEKKWQDFWEENNSFSVTESSDKPKYYILDMFPYPSGAGLHVGHPEGYTATDILARYKRRRGFNVLHPMGWDAFGLPAENHAIQTGTHPSISTQKNIDNFRRQIKMLGFSYDWNREFSTTDPSYFKWTQWIFKQIFEQGLAYQREMPINWCSTCKVGVANEETVNGVHERCHKPVESKKLKQWLLKITAYADRLLNDLEELDWPESIKEMQRNWIGKSVGAEVSFAVKGHDTKIDVFTTRPDTLFGATYMVLAPEHPLVTSVVSSDCQSQVDDYVKSAGQKSSIDRSSVTQEKTRCVYRRLCD